jgi:ferric-dicitrate binding protein FerR (iron transport regulator)
MPSHRVKIIAFFMSAVLPATLFSADMVGVVRVSGNAVTLDGHACDSGVVGFDGERLATGADSKATVTSRGTTISLASNSNVKLGTKTLQFLGGSIVVSSDAGTSTAVEDVIISTPPGIHAKFVAHRTDNELQVVAMEGSVAVSDGQESTTVPAVQGGKIPLGNGKSNKTGHKRFAWLKNDDLGALLAIGGAITAGVVLGILNLDSSPKHP